MQKKIILLIMVLAPVNCVAMKCFKATEQTVSKDFTDIKDTLKTHGEKLEAIIKHDVTTVTGDIKSLTDTGIKELKTSLTNLKKEITDAVVAEVKDLKEKTPVLIDEIKTKVLSFETKLVDLEKKLPDFEQKFLSLEGNISNLSKDVTSVVAFVQNFETKYGPLFKDMGGTLATVLKLVGSASTGNVVGTVTSAVELGGEVIKDTGTIAQVVKEELPVVENAVKEGETVVEEVIEGGKTVYELFEGTGSNTATTKSANTGEVKKEEDK